MTPADFKAWRKRLRLSQAEAAAKLGIKPRMIAYYEAGSREDGRRVEIPKYIRLAMASVALGLEDYDGG